jgi:hypothetical protein
MALCIFMVFAAQNIYWRPQEINLGIKESRFFEKKRRKKLLYA